MGSVQCAGVLQFNVSLSSKSCNQDYRGSITSLLAIDAQGGTLEGEVEEMEAGPASAAEDALVAAERERVDSCPPGTDAITISHLHKTYPGSPPKVNPMLHINSKVGLLLSWHLLMTRCTARGVSAADD